METAVYLCLFPHDKYIHSLSMTQTGELYVTLKKVQASL